MNARKVVVALLIIAVAIGGFVAGLILLRQRQDLREKAAVPGGQATVSIQPASGNYNIGDTIPAKIYFNTAGVAISGIAVRLTYPYAGLTPEVSVAGISVNSTLLQTGDWTCPTQNSIQQGGNVIIDIACANTSAAGFSSTTDTLLADLNLKVDRVPATNPVVVRFDPSLSIITQKSDGKDILLVPTSTGTYTVGGTAIPTLTPTPSGKPPKATVTPLPTKKLTPTPTAKITATPTQVASTSATITPTRGETLPPAGVSYPTIMGVGLGILVIVASLLLAL